jgi:hypothetical protein
MHSMKINKIATITLFFILIFFLFDIFTKSKTEIFNTPQKEEEIVVETETIEIKDSSYLNFTII